MVTATMRAFVIFGLFLGIPLAGGVLQPTEMEQYWVESGMSKTILQVELSQARCESSALYKDSCRKAIAEAQKLLPLSELKWNLDMDSVLEQIEALPSAPVAKALIYGKMFAAHLRTFDAHANLVPANAFQHFIGADDVSHNGIGIVSLPTDRGMMVHAVFADSPAEAAGLKVHDHIVRVNGRELGTGIEIVKNNDALVGKLGDELKLEIERDGTSTQLTARIGMIVEKNITVQTLTHDGQKYAYVALVKFKEDSCAQLKTQLEGLDPQVRGLILDLRDNPGGRLDEGLCIASLFVGKKPIVGERGVTVAIPIDVGAPPPDLNSEIHWLNGPYNAILQTLPVTVLVDQLSASASEIVAAAFQDYGRGLVVGERSFGKGSVQTVRSYPLNDNFRLIYTTQLFYRPMGNSNQRAGVEPDFSVPFRFGAGDAERRAPREGDFFPNALFPEAQPAPAVPNLEVGEWARQCVENSALDLVVLANLKRTSGVEDYQKAYGLAVLECVNSQPLQHNSSSSTHE